MDNEFSKFQQRQDDLLRSVQQAKKRLAKYMDGVEITRLFNEDGSLNIYELSDDQLLQLRMVIDLIVGKPHDLEWSPEDVLTAVDKELKARSLPY